MAGLAAVNGVEDHSTVALDTHGGAGIHATGQAGDHGSVFHQGVQGAHGVLHVVPGLVGSGECQGDGAAGLEAPQGAGIVHIGEVVGGEDHLILSDRRGGGGLDHLVHHQSGGAADGERAIHNGAYHVHAGLCISGGMGTVECIRIEVDAAGGYPGLVHTRHGANHLSHIAGAAAVVHLVAQVGGHLHTGFTQHSSAIRPEADGVVSGVAAEQFPFGHHDADGQAGGGIVEISVDAGHHPVALGLQCLGGSGDGGTAGQDTAVGDHRRHKFIGRIGHQILRPQIGVGAAPEHIGGQLRPLVEQGVLCRQVLAQGLGRGGADPPVHRGRAL